MKHTQIMQPSSFNPHLDKPLNQDTDNSLCGYVFKSLSILVLKRLQKRQPKVINNNLKHTHTHTHTHTQNPLLNLDLRLEAGGSPSSNTL